MNEPYLKRNIKDYIGKTYGHLTVIGKAQSSHPYSNSWDFQCICGAIISEQPSRVVTGHKKSCGKCKEGKLGAKPHFDIDSYIGRKENMLTVIGIAPREPGEKARKLLCQCDCGNQTRITPNQFAKEKVMSCGCLRKKSQNEFDGHSKHPLYKIWVQMMRRCYTAKTKHYDRYGGRGISVCEEWHSFNKFAEWSDSIGGRKPGTSLDRIDNDGNYCPENCRWADVKTQRRNTSANVVLEYNGKRKTLIEWSEITGISWVALNHRYHRGWSVERMLTEPIHEKKALLKAGS